MDAATTAGFDEREREEVTLVARGIATAVAPETGLTEVQAALLEAIASALTGVSVDYRALEPLGPDELADVLAGRDLVYRQRIVHHMVLGELVLRPIPVVVAHRVAKYAEALGVKDDFVRVARRYAQGAYGLAWMDLQRNGFVEHVREAGRRRAAAARAAAVPFEPAEVDPELAARWAAFEELPAGTLGRCVLGDVRRPRLRLPGTPGGAPKYLAQHDFVHVLADYGTNLKGELEVFALIGRADPDPKGFAWLATLIGLFETGYIPTPGSSTATYASATCRHRACTCGSPTPSGAARWCATTTTVDLFEVDYYELADRPVEEVREMFGVPPKSAGAVEGGSAGVFDLAGMSEIQRRFAARRRGDEA